MFSLLCISTMLFAFNVANAAAPLCRDEKNQIVDWYVAYKLPKIRESSLPIVRNGLAYLYMTSKTVDKGWQLSKKTIKAKNSIAGNTLAPLYNDTTASQTFFVMYNDDPPNRSTSGKYGHTKGVVMANKKQGFWLIHSVPKYPPVPNSGNDTRRQNSVQAEEILETESEYDYPSSGMNYGQSFLCISMGSDQFDLIGQQMMYNQIIVYRRNIPGFANNFPKLVDAANQKRIYEAPYSNKVMLKSSGGIEFFSFAKSDKWQKDLYDAFVAPTLKSDFLAETWLNGRGRLPSDCEHEKVYNIQDIYMKEFEIDFKSSRDHSKWAVAIDGKGNRTWTCVGDINRADTQYIRGGGTVCFNNQKVWENYRRVVNDVEPCPKHLQAISV